MKPEMEYVKKLRRKDMNKVCPYVLNWRHRQRDCRQDRTRCKAQRGADIATVMARDTMVVVVCRTGVC